MVIHLHFQITSPLSILATYITTKFNIHPKIYVTNTTKNTPAP